MKSATLRTFFACNISETNLSHIKELLSELKSSTPNAVKWVDPKNLHLTIKFLGEFRQADIESIKLSLSNSLSDFSSFPVTIQTLGAFPSFGKPQVIWLGLDGDHALFKLVEIVEKQCAELDYPTESRPFAAHITIGRLRQSASPTERGIIGDVLRTHHSVTIGTQSIEALHFYKSELTPSGPIYQTLFTIPFTS